MKPEVVDTIYFNAESYDERYSSMQLVIAVMYAENEEKDKDSIDSDFRFEALFDKRLVYKYRKCVGVVYRSRADDLIKLTKGVRFYVSCYDGFSCVKALKAYVNYPHTDELDVILDITDGKSGYLIKDKIEGETKAKFVIQDYFA